MNAELLNSLLQRQHLPIPGDSSFLPSLHEPKRSVEVAVIHHHRFAFYYWAKWATENWTVSLTDSASPPDLITIDWHDDVGGECDCIFPELASLIQHLEVDDISRDECLAAASKARRLAQHNVAAYSFIGLRSLNDGHIFPAQWLNTLGNVYVLNKQYDDSSREMVDQFGRSHSIKCFRNPDKLHRELAKADQHPFYLDIDIDYFFSRRGENARQNPRKSICSLLDAKSGWLSKLLSRPLRGVTIALEPSYCGGLNGCLQVYKIISECLFKGDILGPRADWSTAVRQGAGTNDLGSET